MLEEHPSLHTAIILCRSLEELHLRRSPNDFFCDHTRISFYVATKAHVPKVLVLSLDVHGFMISSETNQILDKLSLRVKNKLTFGAETPL